MKCKCCGNEMKKGYLDNPSQPVQWFPVWSKPSPWKTRLGKHSIPLGNSSFQWTNWRADAWLCETCQVVVVPLRSDMK